MVLPVFFFFFFSTLPVSSKNAGRYFWYPVVCCCCCCCGIPSFGITVFFFSFSFSYSSSSLYSYFYCSYYWYLRSPSSSLPSFVLLLSVFCWQYLRLYTTKLNGLWMKIIVNDTNKAKDQLNIGLEGLRSIRFAAQTRGGPKEVRIAYCVDWWLLKKSNKSPAYSNNWFICSMFLPLFPSIIRLF